MIASTVMDKIWKCLPDFFYLFIFFSIFIILRYSKDGEGYPFFNKLSTGKYRNEIKNCLFWKSVDLYTMNNLFLRACFSFGHHQNMYSAQVQFLSMHCIVFLSKTLHSHSVSLCPGVYCKWVLTNFIVRGRGGGSERGVILQWTSITSKGSINTATVEPRYNDMPREQ